MPLASITTDEKELTTSKWILFAANVSTDFKFVGTIKLLFDVNNELGKIKGTRNTTT